MTRGALKPPAFAVLWNMLTDLGSSRSLLAPGLVVPWLSVLGSLLPLLRPFDVPEGTCQGLLQQCPVGEWSAAHSFSTVGKQSAKLSNRVTAPHKSSSSKQASQHRHRPPRSLPQPLSHRVVCTVSCRCCPAGELAAIQHRPPARSRILQLSPNSANLWLLASASWSVVGLPVSQSQSKISANLSQAPFPLRC